MFRTIFRKDQIPRILMESEFLANICIFFVSLIPTKFTEILCSCWGGVALTNCLLLQAYSVCDHNSSSKGPRISLWYAYLHIVTLIPTELNDTSINSSDIFVIFWVVVLIWFQMTLRNSSIENVKKNAATFK